MPNNPTILIIGIIGVFLIVGSLYFTNRPEGPIAVMDTQGLCWVAERGRITNTGVVLESNGGTLRFYSPIMVYSYKEHVPKKTISRILRVDLKYCTHLH